MNKKIPVSEDIRAKLSAVGDWTAPTITAIKQPGTAQGKSASTPTESTALGEGTGS